METVELGRALKARRAAAGRTIASVAADAGLSVPYIANLENGRGNPTLSAVAALAGALGARLVVELDAAPAPDLPDSLVRFARTERFRRDSAGLPRERLLQAMAAMAAVSPRPASTLDWDRLLDVAVLISRA